jgi:hypothetical protein
MHPIPTACRFLCTLAVLGMVLAPMARPVMAMPADQSAGMHHHATMTTAGEPDNGGISTSEGMPCCPDEAPVSDCGMNCAMMMCAASLSPTLPGAAWLPVPKLAPSELVDYEEAALSGRSPGPPPRPPKA